MVLGLVACEQIDSPIGTIDCGEERGPDEIIRCEVSFQLMEKGVADLSLLNARALYLDFSTSNIPLLDKFYRVNVTLYENGSMVSGRSFQLSKSGQRLYLLDPAGFKSWLMANGNANEVRMSINGLDFELHAGANQTTVLLVYDGQLLVGASDASYVNNCTNCMQY